MPRVLPPLILLLARVFAYVCALASIALLLPLAIAIADGDTRATWAFATPMTAGLVAALALLPRLWRRRGGHVSGGGGAPTPNAGDAIAAVGAAWVAIGLFGAIPLRLSGALPTVTDAVFESVSGFTTTGATVLGDVETLPRAVNVWRCETHWLGGMGVIALVVALVPLLGIGGFRLMNAESSGPEKGKLTARIADTAKVLWGLYIGLTALQTALLHHFGNMDWIEALCHAFSTLGTGGFSTRNASLAAFHSPAAEWICTVFMLAASVSFAIYYRLLVRRGDGVRRATEPRAFLGIVAVATVLVTLALVRGSAEIAAMPFGRALRLAAFQVATVISTTGFASDDYAQWVPAAQAVLFALLLVGGCSGSTAGGVKIVRWAVLTKQAGMELRRLLHPRGVYTVRIDGMPVHDGLVARVAAFLFAYLLLCGVTALAGAMAGLPPLESITAALSMVGNVGPALGKLGPTANYGALPAVLKWWYCFAMLAGRLEIYTMLILIGRLLLPRSRHGNVRPTSPRAIGPGETPSEPARKPNP